MSNENNFAKEIIISDIDTEMRQSYMDYAFSVISNRALPDVRDGFKPVHRRIIFAMSEMGLVYGKPFKKSARVVGDVIGKYHPHGDVAVYDAAVRMAQDFSMRYPLVDGQGNFGSIDGDSPAAMRYTEVRSSKLISAFIGDLHKDTVSFKPNYDETEHEPTVLPATVPNILINGSSGIAVGMATNIPPHNITDVMNACIAFLLDPEASDIDLISIIQGPDFPTGAKIMGVDGIIKMYLTGQGKITTRSVMHVEKYKNKEAIVVTEIPYMVNKAKVIESIASLVKDKKIEGIADIRDESDKSGYRIFIELKKDENAELIQNILLKETKLQDNFNANMVALVNGMPCRINLKTILKEFIRFRKEVVIRRSIFELKKAKEKANNLEGLSVALENIDEIIAIIKAEKLVQEARVKLLGKRWKAENLKLMITQFNWEAVQLNDNNEYTLNETQVQSILDLRLQKLTGIEINKIRDEYKDLLKSIIFYKSTINDSEVLKSVILEEFKKVIADFGDERRTTIEYDDNGLLNNEDLIPDEDKVITISYYGYIKCQPIDDYVAQNRGGKGKIGSKTKEDDYIKDLVIASSLETMLFFSNLGKVYSKKVYSLPHAGRTAKGKPLNTILPLLSPTEKITNVINVSDFDEESCVFMVTVNGIGKKVYISDFAKIRSSGIAAINLDDGDRLVGVSLNKSDESDEEILLITKDGMGIKFKASQVRVTGRSSRGVIVSRLDNSDSVVSALTVNDNSKVLISCENGFGKITEAKEFRTIHRGGKGVIAITTSDRNGLVAGATIINNENDDVMIATNSGMIIRVPASTIPESGRTAQGVRLIRLSEESEKIVAITSFENLI
jgi:DNA gyrase subunit A